MFLLSAGTRGFTLAALASFNRNKLPPAQQLRADVLRSIQELQLEHWGSAEVGILLDDIIQELILGANKLLDLSLSMEKVVLDIRQSALRTYNVALGGQACGKMLKLLEDVFGYEESPESISCGEAQTPISTDSESETEGAGNAEGPTSHAHAQLTLNPQLEPGNKKIKEWSPGHHHPTQK